MNEGGQDFALNAALCHLLTVVTLDQSLQPLRTSVFLSVSGKKYLPRLSFRAAVMAQSHFDGFKLRCALHCGGHDLHFKRGFTQHDELNVQEQV